MNSETIESARRDTGRWQVLLVLDAARPFAVSESLILAALETAHLRWTPAALRRELDYLAALGLIEIEGRETSALWSAKLSAKGVDVVEYVAPVPRGIVRPLKGNA